jgi:hypothetical protein
MFDLISSGRKQKRYVDMDVAWFKARLVCCRGGHTRNMDGYGHHGVSFQLSNANDPDPHVFRLFPEQ